MDKTDLKARTKAFAIQVILFINNLPKSKANDVITYQLIKSVTSTAANYRAALRGRSSAEFISKLNIVLEEVDETLFWLEIISETNIDTNKEILNALLKESNELTAIFVATLKTARNNLNKKT